MSVTLNVLLQTPNPVGFLAKSGTQFLNFATLRLENYSSANYALGKYVLGGTRVGVTPIVQAIFPDGAPGTKLAPVKYDIIPVEALNGTHQEGDPYAGGIYSILYNGVALADDVPADQTVWPVTVGGFKDRFDRDFPFGAGMDAVRDKDITRALNDAGMIFNSSVWESDQVKIGAFLLIAAHCLWCNLQASGGLVLGGGKKGATAQPGGAIGSKSVGQVSVSYQLPPKLVNDPVCSGLMRSAYGVQYLQMFLPRKVGAGFVVGGWRDPGLPS